MIYLTEATRQQLITKSKTSPKGKQRFNRRLKSRIANSVREYNNINMNDLFKKDKLDINIKVVGETNNYLVTISFYGLLENLRKVIKSSNIDELDLRVLIKSIMETFNKDDVYIYCSCPDNYYRFSYQQTRNKVSSGPVQMIPANIRNPHDTLGSGCKHILLVLNNTSWIIKLASVIKNYANYMKKHNEQVYAEIIYPAIFGKEYEDEYQTSMFTDIDTDSDTLDKSNIEARKRGQWQAGNEYRFTQNGEPSEDQISIEDTEEI